VTTHKIIVNPYAGRWHGAEIIDEVKHIFEEKNLRYDLSVTERPGHAVQLAREAAKDFDIVVAVGGDGTVHEVVNGLLTGPVSRTLAVVPVGSGNDFSKAIGTPQDIYGSIDLLQRGQRKLIDVGRVGDRFFPNGLGIGFDAVVTHESAKVKKLRGMAIYLYAIMRTAFTYRAPKMRIHFNGQTIEQRTFLITVGNGISLGGGFYLTPDALIDDGLFDICIIRRLGLMQIFQHLPKALDGSHTTLKQVTMDRTTRITVESDAPLPVHADGEVLTLKAPRVEAEIVPGCLEVIGGWTRPELR